MLVTGVVRSDRRDVHWRKKPSVTSNISVQGYQNQTVSVTSMSSGCGSLYNFRLTAVLDLFPQLDHQKRVIAKSMKKQNCPSRYRRRHSRSVSSSRSLSSSGGNFMRKSPESYSRSRFRSCRSRSRSVESQRQEESSYTASISSSGSSRSNSPFQDRTDRGNTQE